MLPARICGDVLALAATFFAVVGSSLAAWPPGQQYSTAANDADPAERAIQSIGRHEDFCADSTLLFDRRSAESRRAQASRRVRCPESGPPALIEVWSATVAHGDTSEQHALLQLIVRMRDERIFAAMLAAIPDSARPMSHRLGALTIALNLVSPSESVVRFT